MIRKLSTALKTFAQREDGTMVVPVALWTPVFLGLILSSVELGAVSVRQTAMERAVDTAVRELRLTTGTAVDPTNLKQTICDEAAVLPSCMDMMHLEMVSLDMRNWSAPSQQADCVDTMQEITPNRTFQNGASNEMMLIRACYKYRPITPAGTISSSLSKDDEGYTAIIVSSAFVHEPE